MKLIASANLAIDAKDFLAAANIQSMVDRHMQEVVPELLSSINEKYPDAKVEYRGLEINQRRDLSDEARENISKATKARMAARKAATQAPVPAPTTTRKRA